MRVWNWVVIGLLSVGLLVCGVGWYMSATADERGGFHGSDERFESCGFDDEVLTLAWIYGANQAISPKVDTRGPDVIVSLEVEQGDGVTPAIGLSGNARFAIFGGATTIRYPDGTELECTRAGRR